MPLVTFKGKTPLIADDVFLAPDAWLTGDVTVGESSSIFFGVTARGDIQPIKIGNRTNLQEHVILHTSHGLPACQIGDDVTVGHRAIVHGATVQNRCIIGMGAVILDGAVVGEDSIIGAQALVAMNAVIPPRSLAVGVPARVVRELTDDDLVEIRRSAAHYVETGREYRKIIKV